MLGAAPAGMPSTVTVSEFGPAGPVLDVLHAAVRSSPAAQQPRRMRRNRRRVLMGGAAPARVTCHNIGLDNRSTAETGSRASAFGNKCRLFESYMQYDLVTDAGAQLP